MPKIEIKDLIKVYRTGKTEVIALRGLKMDVSHGEIIAVMGPSGCGKSTLLNLIGGLDRPTAGSIKVDGLEITQLSDKDFVKYRRDYVGFVFQFFNLIPNLTAEENIELPMILANKPANERKARTNELLELVKLSERRTHLPDELSGGEQQRVAIAMALVNNPPIVLADEPTGELDSNTGREVLNIFKFLKEKYNKTEIIVTHDRRIGDIADRILTIEDGMITGELSKGGNKKT
ncbi:MAG: ABC transporter ATP-binding protein [Candidatus Thermoplasmatota archaeon]